MNPTTATLAIDARPREPVDHVSLLIDGMTCASCVARVEKALAKVDGVVSAQVNLATETATIGVANRNSITDALLAAVAKAGYVARVPVPNAPATPQPAESSWPLVAAVLLSIPLVLPMIAALFGQHWMLAGALQFALATPVQFVLGARFYKAAWKALRAGAGNMDLLVALGTSAADGLSVYEWLHQSGERMPHL